MKVKMGKDYDVKLIPENDFEKNVVSFDTLLKKGDIEQYIDDMSLSELLYCKVVLLYIEKMLIDKIGYLRQIEIN